MNTLNTCRVCVVGDRGVGKTALIRKFLDDYKEVSVSIYIFVKWKQIFLNTRITTELPMPILLNMPRQSMLMIKQSDS